MRVCLSHGGRTMYDGNEAVDELLVGTLDGVARLVRGGDDWQEAERTLTGHHVSVVVEEPSSGTVFAGTHGQGIFASTDGGRTWEPRNSGLSQQNIYSINFTDAGGALRLYAGTEPVHLFVSEDLGRTWSELTGLQSMDASKWMFPAPPHNAHLKNINFDNRDPDVLLVGIEVGGLYRSADRGQSWKKLDGVYEDVHRVVMPPSNPDRLYVTGGNGVYLSPNGGQDWERLSDRTMRVGYPDALLIHPEQENLMFTAGAFASPRYWAEAGTANPRVARSLDAGRTWEVTDKGLPEHIHGNIETMVMVTQRDTFSLYAATTDGEVFASEDEGNTWRSIVQGLPAISKGGHYQFRGIPSRDEAAALAAAGSR